MSTVFLYPTAQRYYCSVRDHDKLVIEYDALVDRNQECNPTSIPCKPMQRRAACPRAARLGEKRRGIRQRARFEPGGNPAGSTITPNISSDSVQAPDTWYSPLLDLVFGYK